MKLFEMKFAGAAMAALLGTAMLSPAHGLAQATIHGHVQNAAGQPLGSGDSAGAEVRLSTDKNPSAANAKFEYTFPVDPSGNYKGTVDKPGNYIAGVFVQGHSVDFMPAPIAAGEDKTVDFDMTRKEYIDKMSPAERDQLEEYKKKNAAAVQANSKIDNLNKLLKDAQASIKAGNYDVALKNMTDATAAKPDEPILWNTLGDAQLGQANAEAKTAHDAKTTDASLPDKYNAAIASYKKALTLNAAAAKPNAELTGVANNQMAQALGKVGKNKDAAAAYDAAAAADPTKAGMYYFNEAATFLNASNSGSADAGPLAAAAAEKAITADPTRVDAYYIKAEGLAPSITQGADGKFIAPPGMVEACNKYLELAPTGPHAQEMKDLLSGIGMQVQTTYKAPSKKK
jgi:hypothetical protein